MTAAALLVDRAYEHLSAQLELSRDRDRLLGDQVVALIAFEEANGNRADELWLRAVDVTPRGAGLGTKMIESLREFVRQNGAVLRVGPCINARYWHSSDGTHPDRFPWLALIGEEDGSPVYLYQSDDVASGHSNAAIRTPKGTEGRDDRHDP